MGADTAFRSHWGQQKEVFAEEQRKLATCVHQVSGCFLCRLEPAVKPTQEDAEVLSSVQSVVELMQTEGLLPNAGARSARHSPAGSGRS